MRRTIMEIPRHVAIILDGNGRWAKSRNMPRNYGHVKGAANVEVICRAADELGIKYLTVYLFSTENWRRSQDEVKALMKLFHSYTRTAIRQARENNMRCRVLGDPSALDATLQKNLRELVESSKDNTGLNFQLAINYGSRDEIVRAVRKISADVRSGEIPDPEQITEEMFASYLDTGDIPDPDLLIRTSGEQRLSNYLMWQLAYAELYFTQTPWPAFSKKDLELAIEAYNQRTRRFGGLKKGEEDVEEH
jgi:undecaprenyl diphosphate synthase